MPQQTYLVLLCLALLTLLALLRRGMMGEPAAALSEEEKAEWQKTWKLATSTLALSEDESVFVQSVEVGKPNLPMPAVLLEGVRYSLTGMNPMAKRADDEFNRRANLELQAVLQSMHPRPISILPSSAEDDDWKEEGFTVQFPLEGPHHEKELDEIMVATGRRFQQAAIYKYRRAVDSTQLLQWVLPCSPSLAAVASETSVAVVSPF
ncbi:unnamed protein product [Symbiodinium sp. CCMP2592]|nr:unnamed protein product [Symbiodinium sp. CCMP2592]